MHAVVARVSFDPAREEEAVAGLKSMVVPRVKEAPGVVAGYWLDHQEGHGLGFVLFENEEAAQAGAEAARTGPRPDFVTMDSVEVREVIAQI